MLQALCLIGGNNQGGQITSVVANRSGTGVELVVRGEGLQQPRVLPLIGGRGRVLEFDAGMDGVGEKTNVGYGGVRSFNTSWISADPARVRIGIQMDRPSDPVLTQTADGWLIDFGVRQAPLQVLGNHPARLMGMSTRPVPSTGELVGIHPALVTPPHTVGKVPSVATYIPPAPAPQDKVTIDFNNTDIVQILKAVALQSGVNIVTSPDVKATLTVSLRNVSVEEALKIVTTLAGLSYAQVGSAYIVAPADKLQDMLDKLNGITHPVVTQPTDPVVSRAYLVQGGLAADLVKAVAGDKGTVGQLSLVGTPAQSVSRQTVVITGPERQVMAMMDTLRLLDSAEEANSQFDIYDVRYLDPRSAREQLIAAIPGLRATLAPSPAGNPKLYTAQETIAQSQQGQQATTNAQVAQQQANANALSGGPGGGELQIGTQTSVGGNLLLPYDTFERVSYPMRLILRGTSDQLRAAHMFLEKTDVSPKQVALELRVMELSREDAMKLGLDWSILNASGFVKLVHVNEGFGTGADTPGNGGFNTGSGTVVGTLDQLSDNRHLIARPNLLALDGRESEVFVGDVVRYIKSIQATQNGITVLIDEVRVGVRFSVLPRIGADGNVSLDVRPTVSFLRSFDPIPGGGSLPQTSERTTQNTTVMQSGQTIALGGLIQDIDRKSVSGIPILKDLPIVGMLFRKTNNDRLRTEIVFFLTVKQVDQNTIQNAAAPKPDAESAINGKGKG